MQSDNGDNDSNNQPVVLGKIVGFHGVKGWLKVHSETAPRENIVSYSQWLLGGSQRQPSHKITDWQTVKVTSGRKSGKNIIAQLDGIDSREKAETLLGKTIAVRRSALPSLADDEVYWTDLVGCTVVDNDGQVIGPLQRLFETGANDVMVVLDHRDTGESADDSAQKYGAEILIPWIRPSVVTKVDLVQRRIEVDWDPDF